MKFDKVLLVQARYDSVFSNVLPAGIGYLSEFLLQKGLECDVFDLNLKDNRPKELFHKIRKYRPKLVGFSMMSLNYKYNYSVIDELKRLFPDIKVVVGGSHISTLREKVLTDCPGIDYGIVLEGEYSLLELMEGKKPLEDLRGLLYRDRNGEVVFSGEREFIRDLDAIPFPRYSLFNKKKYSTLISIISSRGCPFGCIYCPVQLAIGRRFVPRSPSHVISEIEYHYARGYREFSFRDDNFTLIQQRAFQICDEVEKKNFKDLFLMSDNGVRADKVSFELLKRMRQVGFRMISSGVESGSNRILKILKKGQTVADAERMLKWTAELDYMVELFFLIGTPGERWEDFEKSVELAAKFPIITASFYHLLPYPNTELYEMVRKNNQLLRPPDEYLNDGSQRRNTPFFETKEMPYKMRLEAFDYAQAKLKTHLKAVNKKFYKKNAREKFIGLGLNEGLANVMANVYCISFLHDIVFNNAFSRGLKTFIKKLSLNLKMRSSIMD